MAKMWNVICVLILAFAGANSDKFFPKFDLHHHHSKVTYLKDKQSGNYGDNNKGQVFFQKPEDKQSYKSPFDDGYKQSWKTLRSEKYQTETIDNPHSSDPTNRYLVKGVYQVREKLPYEDTTIGYDKEYHYPSADIDSDYHTSAKFVDFHNAQTDPFGASDFADYSPKVSSAKSKPDYEEFDPKKLESPKSDYEAFNPQDYKVYSYTSNYGDATPGKVGKVVAKQKAKPKEVVYQYKSPAQDLDYYKNVNLIDSYLAKTKSDVSLPLQDEPKESFGLNNLDYGYSPPSYKSSNYDSLGPSDIQNYQNYKTDGPSLAYLQKEFGDYS